MNIFKKKPAKKIIARRIRQYRYWKNKIKDIEEYQAELEKRHKGSMKSAAGRDWVNMQIKNCQIDNDRAMEKLKAIIRWFNIYSPTTEL